MAAPEPYSKTPVYDADSLPEAIRNAHNTKAGVWGLLRVISGEVRLVFHEPRVEHLVKIGSPAVIPPQEVHHVEILGLMQMQVEFYREPPLG